MTCQVDIRRKYGPQARKAERPPAGAAQPEHSPGEANSTEDASAEALA